MGEIVLNLEISNQRTYIIFKSFLLLTMNSLRIKKKIQFALPKLLQPNSEGICTPQFCGLQLEGG